MHNQQFDGMGSLHDIAALLQSRMSDLLVVSDAYSWIVKIISWFFITLALSMGLPIAFMIVFDFFLWVYRLVFPAALSTTKNARARRRRESLSHPIMTTS